LTHVILHLLYSHRSSEKHCEEAVRNGLDRIVAGSGKDVAAELVGAEEVVGARWQQPLGGIAGERIETGEQSGPQGRGSGEGEDGDGPDGAEPRRGRGEAAKDTGDSIAVRSRAGFDAGPDRDGRTLGVLLDFGGQAHACTPSPRD